MRGSEPLHLWRRDTSAGPKATGRLHAESKKVVTAQTPVGVISAKGSLAPFAQRLTIRISGNTMKGQRRKGYDRDDLGVVHGAAPLADGSRHCQPGCFVMDEQACVPYGTRCLHDGQLPGGTRLRGNRVFLLADLWPGEFLGHTAGDISPACCPE